MKALDLTARRSSRLVVLGSNWLRKNAEYEV